MLALEHLGQPGRTSGSGGFGFFQAQFQLHRIAHHKLLDLACDGHRKGVHKLDVARHFVVRDFAFAEIADVLGRGALPRLQDDPGAQLLAVLLWS